MRSHSPFGAVHRLAELGEVECRVESLGGAHVLYEVVADGEARVIPPLVRISDLGDERGDLLQRVGFGFFAHPVEGGDRSAVGLQQVADQLEHLFLVFGREMPGDVLSSQGFAERVLDDGDPALPPLALLGGSAQHLAVEVEVRPVDLLGEERGPRTENAPARVSLEVGKRGFGPQARCFAQSVRLHDDHVGRAVHRHLGARQRGVPGEAGRRFDEIGPDERVVEFVGVARVDDVHVGGGDRGLQAKDDVGLGSRLLLAEAVAEGQEPRHEIRVLGQGFGVLLLAVVRLVGKAEAGLLEEGDVSVGVRQIGVDVPVEEGRHSRGQEFADDAREALAVRCGLDRGEVGPQRSGSLGVQSIDVHPRGEKGADFVRVFVRLAALVGISTRLFGAVALRVPARMRIGFFSLREVLDDLPHVLFRLKDQFDEAADPRKVFGNLGRLQPSAVDGAKDVVLNSRLRIVAVEYRCTLAVSHGAILAAGPRARIFCVCRTPAEPTQRGRVFWADW